MTDDKINWETIRQEGRAKMIYLDAQDVVHYFAVVNGAKYLRDPHLIHFAKLYDLPERWSFGSVHDDPARRAFGIIIFSPEFDAVAVGAMIPTLGATQCEVKVTRELVSKNAN